MCGIVGIVGDDSPEARRRIAQESTAMWPRGPHAEGSWQEGDALLAHRRLMVIDLSNRSNQPISSPSMRYVVVYNGEIYNFHELFPDVPSDTLAIGGDGALAGEPHRLRGMFAFGRWDRKDRRLSLVRDRFGIKPLYYAQRGPSFAFASTCSAVARLQDRHQVDAAAVASFLRLGSVQGPGTIVSGVNELDPGSTLEWKDGIAVTRRYWEFEDVIGTRPARHLHAALRGSVVAHGVSDVPIALFLSGGVDSAVIGALAVEAGLDLTAFTLGFPGSDVDETEDARQTAKTLGLKHEVVDFRDVEPDFDGYFSATDQPSIDGLNTHLVSRAAAEAGFRVALTGLGADEIFAGYSSFRRIPALWAMNLVVPPAAAAAVLRTSGGNAAKAASLAAAGADLNRLNEELRSVFSTREVERLTGVRWAAPDVPVSIRTPMDAVTRLEVENYLRNTLLRDSDVFSMAHSLELRTPFVDHEVLAAALSIPNWQRACFRKGLLAKAIGVPRVRELLRKPKRGFRLPFPHWLRGTLSERVAALTDGPVADTCDVAEIRLHVNAWRNGQAPYPRIWSLVVLDAWMRRLSERAGTAS